MGALRGLVGGAHRRQNRVWDHTVNGQGTEMTGSVPDMQIQVGVEAMG